MKTKYDQIFNCSELTEESLIPEEGVAAIALVTAIATYPSGEVDVENLVGMLWELQVFEEYSQTEITEIVYNLMAIAEEESLGTLFNIARDSLMDDMVFDAFGAGVMVLLDEETLIVPKPKQPYLKKLQQALDIKDEEAEQIIQELISDYEEDDDDNDDYPEDEEDIINRDYGEDVYQSPGGNFSVPIPIDLEAGGTLKSQDGMVVFCDQLGTMLRIDDYLLSSEQLQQLESIGEEEYLQSILLNKYLPEVVFSNAPKAEVIYTEYLPDTLEGSYFALVDIQSNGGNAQKIGNRGLLAFMNTNYLYIVSSQDNFFDDENQFSLEEEAEDIKEAILGFVDTIEFAAAE